MVRQESGQRLIESGIGFRAIAATHVVHIDDQEHRPSAEASRQRHVQAFVRFKRLLLRERRLAQTVNQESSWLAARVEHLLHCQSL
jgi:hypothetical protein